MKHPDVYSEEIGRHRMFVERLKGEPSGTDRWRVSIGEIEAIDTDLAFAQIDVMSQLIEDIDRRSPKAAELDKSARVLLLAQKLDSLACFGGFDNGPCRLNESEDVEEFCLPHLAAKILHAPDTLSAREIEKLRHKNYEVSRLLLNCVRPAEPPPRKE